jgi:hypothetical protein
VVWWVGVRLLAKGQDKTADRRAGRDSRALICKPFKEPRESIPSLAGQYKQPYSSCRSAMLHRLAKSNPRNRFLVSLNVNNYVLWQKSGELRLIEDGIGFRVGGGGGEGRCQCIRQEVQQKWCVKCLYKDQLVRESKKIINICTICTPRKLPPEECRDR